MRPRHDDTSAVGRVGAHLRLLRSGGWLEALIQHAAPQGPPYAEFLERVLGNEVAAKTSKNIALRMAMTRLSFDKPLETLEFDYQPSINRTQVRAVASYHFIEHSENVIVLKPLDVGKMYLAVSLGRKAMSDNYAGVASTSRSSPSSKPSSRAPTSMPVAKPGGRRPTIELGLGSGIARSAGRKRTLPRKVAFNRSVPS